MISSAYGFQYRTALRSSAIGALAAAMLAAPAQAALVSACTGVSLPRSTVTDIVGGPLLGVVNPLQGAVNGLLPIAAPLSIDAAGLLATAASGAPITLEALDVNGVIVGPADACQTTADGFQLDTPAGISIGGNRIAGLGSEGLPASAGELGSIALGDGAATSAPATDAVAIGSGATVTAANSVALGAGATGTRGALAGYAVPGLGAQTSAGEVSVGAPGAERQITNVAAGSAPSDAATVGQVSAAVAASDLAQPVQYSTAAAPTTPNPGIASNDVTLVGTAPGTAVALHNVAPGVLAAGSTDAVNGGQLFATNGQVAANTTAITNLSNGTAGLVQQDGGSPGAGAIRVGAATGGTTVSVAGTGGDRILTGVAPGLAANDAATVGQLGQVVGGAFNAVQYDTDGAGGRLDTVTLAGGTGAPVTVTNVAGGALVAGSTDAVNGGQLAASNAQIVTNSTTINSIVAGNAGAFRSNNAAVAAPASASGANASAGGFGASASGVQSVALGNGAVATGNRSVALGVGSSDGGVANVVSVGSVGAERRITNVGPALNGTDAVNLAQLQAATGTINSNVTNLQGQIDGLGFDLRKARRKANAGTAGAMAVAALPQPFSEGAGMVAGAVGYWQDQVAFAIGVSKIVSDQTIVKAGASVSGRGSGGFNAGVGFQF